MGLAYLIVCSIDLSEGEKYLRIVSSAARVFGPGPGEQKAPSSTYQSIELESYTIN